MAKKKKKQTVRCKECGGEGTVVYRQGFFTLSGDCPDCEGTGHKLKPSANEELKERLLH